MTSTVPQEVPNPERELDYNVETEVLKRYRDGAKAVEPSLCCPTNYDDRYLKILPAEILEKDYGCGDPSRYVSAGETVLDLGAGVGKICYILAQKVGSTGRVIGVDFNETMLAIARKYHVEMAEKIGYDAVQFVKGKIQDLALDLDKVQAWLDRHSITNIDDWIAFEAECDRLRRQEPLIADDSIDVVVSNCVLNLVSPADKTTLFREIHRVLRVGGRAVISDIVCDRDPTPTILNDPELWSGCIAGAFRDDRFLDAFEAAGFYGIELLDRQVEPWQTVDGIDFRSVTVRAYKGDAKDDGDGDGDRVAIYKGPWKQVCDDRGNLYRRGERTPVSEATYGVLTAEGSPYGDRVFGLSPAEGEAKSATDNSDCCGSIPCC